MKILIACQHGKIIGGAETYAFSIAKVMAEKGHCVGIAVADSPSNIDDFNICGVEWLGRHDSPGSWLNAMRAFAPDVVYSQVLTDPRIDSAFSAQAPLVMFVHGYAGTCISGTKQYRFPSLGNCNRSLGISCLAANWLRRCGGLNPITALRAYRREWVRQNVLSSSKTICVASHHMRAVMIQNGVPESKVRLLPLFPPHGDRDSLPPAPRPYFDKVLFAGRLTRLKGWTHLVPAIAMASRALARRLTLVVAGDGPDRDRLVCLATKWNVPLDFRGWLEPKPLKTLMGQVDLLAFPSLWPEPFGLVGIEAGCVGTPAVAYGVGGIPDWMVPGVSGEMAPGDDLGPKPLADAIVRALRDADHWQRLREGAWRQAGLLSCEKHLTKLMKIFLEAS